jgi:phage gpG-like protein
MSIMDIEVTVKEKNPQWLKGFKRTLDAIEKSGTLECAVGFPSEKGGSDTYSDTGATVGQVAMWNEYGVPAGNIPARPFMQTADPEIQEVFNDTMAAAVQGIMTGKVSVEEVLNDCGEVSVEVLKDTIASGGFAANAPSTVKKKGSSTPLIDTGTLYDHITYVVRDKE